MKKPDDPNCHDLARTSLHLHEMSKQDDGAIRFEASGVSVDSSGFTKLWDGFQLFYPEDSQYLTIKWILAHIRHFHSYLQLDELGRIHAFMQERQGQHLSPQELPAKGYGLIEASDLSIEAQYPVEDVLRAMNRKCEFSSDILFESWECKFSISFRRYRIAFTKSASDIDGPSTYHVLSRNAGRIAVSQSFDFSGGNPHDN